jgi:uncharacterized SAM-binding protein YcdF (DUF218 family)
MRPLVAFVKQFLIPGSLTFLIAGLVVALLLLSSGPTALPWGRAVLVLLLVLYWLLSLPAVAHALIEWLQQGHETLTASDAEALETRVLVVVGNGTVHYTSGRFASHQLTRRSTFCAFEAARLYPLIRPDWIVATGGSGSSSAEGSSEAELLRDMMVKCLVPEDRILLESTSTTTDEQVSNVLQLLGERGLGGVVVVVTTPAHMSRVMKLFRVRGVQAVASVTPDLRYDEGRTGWQRWWPNGAALIGSQSALYEGLAHVYWALK